MLPLCRSEGIGVIPWSPLARGRLTRDWDAHTARSETDEFGKKLYQPQDQKIVEAVARIAGSRGLSRAQVALAWILGKPGVTSPIVGATKPEHLSDAIAAVSVKLEEGEVAALEADYVPHAVAGHT